MNLKNKQKGFTLVELVLIVGIIAIMSIGIYIKYRSVTNAQKIELQVQDLYAISNNITKGYQSETTLGGALFNNTNLISKGLIPVEIANSPNINSRFGTTITLSNPVPGMMVYEILINNITPKECASIGTTKFANDVDEVWINGANRRATGTQLTSANIATIVTECNTANSIRFRNRVYLNPRINDYDSTRKMQTNKYYIPTLNDNVTSASTTCSMGGTWTGSFCSCGANAEFDGNACVPYSIKNCQYGTGLKKIGAPGCSALDATKASETFFNGTTFVTQAPPHYTPPPTTQAACITANGYWDATTGICGGVLPTKTTGAVTAPAPVYLGNRNFPQTMKAEVNNLVSDNEVRDGAAFCSANGGNWDGKICNYCPSPNSLTTNTVIVDAKTGTATVSNMGVTPATTTLSPLGHAASSVWNVDRCVTPSAGPMGPTYPQLVTW